MGFIGRLEDMPFADIVQMLSMSRRTGRLTLTEGVSRAWVVFRQGDILAASVGEGGDALGQTLLKRGIIDQEALQAALRVQQSLKPPELLGRVLLDLNLIGAETLAAVITDQVEEVLGELMYWENGSFKFEPMTAHEAMGVEIAGSELVVPTGLRTDYAMLEAVRRRDERDKDQRTVPPKTTRPAGNWAARDAEGPTLAGMADEVTRFSPAQLVGMLMQASREREAAVREGATPPPLLGTLKSIMEEGRTARTPPEIALLVMRCATAVVNRGVLLSLSNGILRGIGQYGLQLPDNRANERVRNIRIPVDQPSIFQGVVAHNVPFRGRLKRCWWND
jgi:hypothetical protein